MTKETAHIYAKGKKVYIEDIILIPIPGKQRQSINRISLRKGALSWSFKCCWFIGGRKEPLSFLERVKKAWWFFKQLKQEKIYEPSK